MDNLNFEGIVKTFRDEGIYGPTSKPKLEPIIMDKPVVTNYKNSVFNYPLEPQFVELIQRIVIETMQKSVYKTPQEQQREFLDKIKEQNQKVEDLEDRFERLLVDFQKCQEENQKLKKLIQEIALP
jgi:hypothetical protein